MRGTSRSGSSAQEPAGSWSYPAGGHRRSARRPGPRRRGTWWGLLIVAGLMILGGFAGLIAAAATVASGDGGLGMAIVRVITFSSPSGDFAAILGGWGFVAAGFIIGGWIGIAVMTFRRRGVACPRCGTLNASAASRCEACDLTLR